MKGFGWTEQLRIRTEDRKSDPRWSAADYDRLLTNELHQMVARHQCHQCLLMATNGAMMVSDGRQ